MKKTLRIDEQLLRDAKAASGARTDTETVRLGLAALVRRGAYERLRALRGSEPHARDVPRRRRRSASVKHPLAVEGTGKALVDVMQQSPHRSKGIEPPSPSRLPVRDVKL